MFKDFNQHTPVLLNEVLDSFEPVLQNKFLTKIDYFDGTFGRGGHLQALMEKDLRINAVALDQDPEAIEFGKKKFADWIQNNRLQLINSNFSEFNSGLLGSFDLMLLDLGVSSPQLDQSQRGFSFYQDGPLDMRMDTQKELTAATVLNHYSEEELIRIFKEYGEIFKPYRVVRAIVHDRKIKPYESTLEFASLIERVEGWRRKGFHPATQYFMALRLEVNQELQVIEQAFEKLILGLRPKGRIVVLTFHSLEDRIIKNKMKSLVRYGRIVNKKVIVPDRQEALQNPRARSAKLRAFERGSFDESS